MKKRLSISFIIVSLAFGVIGCSRGPQSAPEKMFKSFQDDVFDGNWEKAFEFATEDTQYAFLLVASDESMKKLSSDFGKNKAEEFSRFLKKQGLDLKKMKSEILKRRGSVTKDENPR